MYRPPAFRIDSERSLGFAAERGFGLVVACEEGARNGFHGVHVPFVLERDGGLGRIRFHVARANPFHEIAARAPAVMVVVSGPDAYVSPDWYESADQVPTWNYAAVHLRGTARVLPPEAVRAHVDELSARFEAELRPKRPWSTAKMTPARLDAMLRAIVALEVEIADVQGQFKLSQNKSAADRQGVAAALDARGEPDRAVAALMRTLPQER